MLKETSTDSRILISKPWHLDPTLSSRYRLGDCAAELGALLKEEKLSGASLLVLANKQDLPGALSTGDRAGEISTAPSKLNT